MAFPPSVQMAKTPWKSKPAQGGLPKPDFRCCKYRLALAERARYSAAPPVPISAKASDLVTLGEPASAGAGLLHRGQLPWWLEVVLPGGRRLRCGRGRPMTGDDVRAAQNSCCSGPRAIRAGVPHAGVARDSPDAALPSRRRRRRPLARSSLGDRGVGGAGLVRGERVE